MNHFIDREEELNFLENEYKKPGSSLIILYGRRRVGKTALINHFSEGKPTLYYLVSEESEQQNRNAFKTLAANFTGNALLKAANIQQWEPIFQVLADSIKEEKLILVLDEFQYLGKSNPAFPSVFQRIWDTILKDRHVMVILCGSLISMMESQTLSYSSPLYGRRTGQIRLKQIPFRDYHGFFPNKSRQELIAYYSVTGGVPKYVELFEEADDIYQAIHKNVLSRSSFLYDEPNFLLQREVSEVGSYFSIIREIAAGNRKLGKIAGALEIKQTGLTRYLKTLTDLDIIKREVPITEENPVKSKRGQYRIKDNFLLFWFRFVFPNLSAIESGHEEIALDKIRKNLNDNHIAFVYEDICLKTMWRMNEGGAWDFQFEKAGRWWDNNTEIDIVALDPSGSNIIFGECKYWKTAVGIDVLNELRQKAFYVNWRFRERKEYYVLFSVSGFTEELIQYAQSHPNIILSS